MHIGQTYASILQFSAQFLQFDFYTNACNQGHHDLTVALRHTMRHVTKVLYTNLVLYYTAVGSLTPPAEF